MKICYCDDDGEKILETESNDLNGLITVLKESEGLDFQKKSYKYDYLKFNHFKDNNGEWQEVVIIYLNEK